MSDRLWSPQMRKWVRDSDRHGIPIGFHKTTPGRYQSDWAGGSGIYLTRTTDDEGIRVIDGPQGMTGPIRTIDQLIYTTQTGIPVYLVADDGVTLLQSESGIQLTP